MAIPWRTETARTRRDCFVAASFDEGVSAEEKRLGNSEPDRSCSLAIDHQLEARRLLDGQGLWICTVENPVDERRGARKHFTNIRSVGHQAAAINRPARAEHGGQSVS